MDLFKETKITILYIIIGLGWIIFSDYFLKLFVENQSLMQTIQSYKGSLYVIITGYLLYLILHKNFEKVRKQNQELKNNYEQLEKDNEEFQSLYEEIENSYEEIQKYYQAEKEFQQELIVAITSILEIHDPYTEGHSKEVAKLCQDIAKKMHLSKNEIEKAYWAGMVHDIGKILIPKSILNKNDDLTYEEYDKIKKHPVWGYQALKHSSRLKEIAKIILYHHERWEGNGYPEGLKQEEIPLISRILCIADSWNAMRSNRPYRSPLPLKKAIQEIKNNKYTQFCPEVSKAFMAILKDN